MTNREDNPITILLVDDDPDCRLLMRDALSECGVRNQVIEVSTGEEAMEILSHHGESGLPRPEIIFLDIEMPGIDGLETLQRIRANPALSHIPVVMMTGVCGQQQIEQAARSGANSYTIKPAKAEQFLSVVQQSTNYWLTVHQYPEHHLAPEDCRK